MTRSFRVAFRLALSVAFVSPLVISPLAHAQIKQIDAEQEYAASTVVQVEGCVWMDALLRKTCARVRPVPPPNEKICELHAPPFKERTAASYAAFRKRFAASIKAMQSLIDDSNAAAQRSLERSYGALDSEEISMLKLELLRREVQGACARTETRWLAPALRPK